MPDASSRRAWLARCVGAGSLWMIAQPSYAKLEPSALQPRTLVFPRDFGAHPQTRLEWWYITGAVSRPDGQRFGFQITFFRSRTELALRQPPHPSSLAARQILFAHAALSDVQAQRLVHAERMVRWNGENSPQATHQAALQDTDVRIGPWQLRREGSADRSSYHAQWHDDAAGFGMNLTLTSTQAVLLQGQQGYSRKGPAPDNASFYYSQPHLRVQGTLQQGSRTHAVSGTAWLDHEWSESLLSPEAVGWDWMGIHLRDGGALTVFQVRGSTPWAGGSLRSPSGATRSFEPHEVRMQPLRLWKSPRTSAHYPVEWAVYTPMGRYTLRALFDAQELDSRASTGTVYWEGLSVLLDEQGQVRGEGYLEMTGYAAPLKL